MIESTPASRTGALAAGELATVSDSSSPVSAGVMKRRKTIEHAATTQQRKDVPVRELEMK